MYCCVQWEVAFTPPELPPLPSSSFPDDDLLDSLVNLYFAHINAYLPLFHRPTFERDIAEKLHLKDDGFAANLLLVCATGSRWSDDPRVRLDGIDSSHTNGWKWFNQVQLVRKSLLRVPVLADLQFYVVSPDLMSVSSMFTLPTNRSSSSLPYL